MAKDHGGPAFPNQNQHGDSDQVGMSLRDWFAGQALVGMLASTAHPNANGPETQAAKGWAQMSYILADAMIAESLK